MFTVAIVSKSNFQKINLIFNKQLEISCSLRTVLVFQLFMSTMLPILAWFSISGMTRTIDVMMNFAGLIVVTDIDNWAGEIFELYIATFHEEILKREDYLEFKSDNEVRAASYYHVIFINCLMFTVGIISSVTKLGVYCPLLDQIRLNSLKNDRFEFRINEYDVNSFWKLFSKIDFAFLGLYFFNALFPLIPNLLI